MYTKDSFSAIDKLLDFAQDTAIQKQMTQSMNETIAQMRIPGVDNPLSTQKKKPGEEDSREN